MIEDLRTFPDRTTLDAEICIVGAGAAGITLALQFLKSHRRVLLLESGGLKPDSGIQSLYEGDVADPALHSPPNRYRQRRFGGSTTIWGGRCMPLDPIDFEHRDWIPHSGWPISWEDLAAYYPRANDLCEAGEFEYDARLALPGGMRPLIRRFAPAEFDTDRIERFSCPTDFARRYGHRLAAAPDLRVILHANCTRLNTSADGARIESAELRTFDGKSHRVRAEQFVLAAGGLEVPRLLLASRDRHANGLGNAHDLVGRFYMCHIAGTLGRLTFKVPRTDVWHGYDVAEDGTYCRRRIALRAEAQRRHRLGNIIFRLHHPRIPDPRHRTGALSAIYLARHLISYEYGKRLTSGGGGFGALVGHGRNLATDPFSTALFLGRWIRRRTLAERKFPSVVIRPRSNVFSLDFHAEQIPDPASRIGLSDATDRFGMPRLLVDWRYTPADAHTVSAAFELLQAEVAAAGAGELSREPDEQDIDAVIKRDGAYGGHHIGTARMGAGPGTGVTDFNGRVFGVNNLYVAGSATFPTSSQANPTLTIVAMALRLADHLKVTAERKLTVGATPGTVSLRSQMSAQRTAATAAR
jgi:choline dehydrogenase-like flavoprotein